MDFRSTSEHELLRQTARDFFASDLPPAEVRKLDSDRRIPREIWLKMGALGWLGLPVPRRYGGAEADVATAAVLTEELARGFASLAVDFVLVSMTARLLGEWGTEEHQSAVLPRVAAGGVVVAFGLTEPGGGTDVLGLKTTATETRGGWVLQGQKLYTSMAADADYILVLARTDPPEDGHRARGLSLVLMPRSQDAVTVRRLSLMGMRAAGTCEVFLDGARAPASAIVGQRGRGFYHLLGTLDNERILAAALSVGIAQAAFEEARRYAQERLAFDRPIGSFQAIQHYLADTAIDIAQSRLLVEKAAWLQSSGLDCALESAMAKVSAAETVVRATDRGMRILAGYGFVEESPMERYFRDSRLQVFSPISNEMARNFIGERLGLPRSY